MTRQFFPTLIIVASSLAFFASASHSFAVTQTSNRVRVLLAIDSHAEGVSEGCRVGGTKMYNVLREGFSRKRGMIDIKILQGTELTPANVLSHIRNLSTNSKETILFYYIGHGAFDSRSGKHFLAMRYGELFRSELRTAIEAKGAGLNVILTDCCSSVSTASRTPQNAPNFNVAPSEPSLDLLTHLLLCQKGTVDITAATPGSLAWGAPDGYFTQAITSLAYTKTNTLDMNRDGLINWSEFFQHVRYQTNNRFQMSKQFGGGGRQVSQIPYAFSLPKTREVLTTTSRTSTARVAPKTTQYVVSTIYNPYDVPLVYHYRWGETGEWRQVTLKPKHQKPHSITYDSRYVPWLNVNFDCVGGDSAYTAKVYQVGGNLSYSQTTGKSHHFGFSGGNRLDLYRTN